MGLCRLAEGEWCARNCDWPALPKRPPLPVELLPSALFPTALFPSELLARLRVRKPLWLDDSRFELACPDAKFALLEDSWFA